MLVEKGSTTSIEHDSTDANISKKSFCLLAKFHVYYSGDLGTSDVFQLFRLWCKDNEVDELLDYALTEYFKNLYVEAEQDLETPYSWHYVNDRDSTASLDGYESVSDTTFDDISLIPKIEYDIDLVRRAVLKGNGDG
jgi:hypothetical protein